MASLRLPRICAVSVAFVPDHAFILLLVVSKNFSTANQYVSKSGGSQLCASAIEVFARSLWAADFDVLFGIVGDTDF